jgi:hypothetical protein
MSEATRPPVAGRPDGDVAALRRIALALRAIDNSYAGFEDALQQSAACSVRDQLLDAVGRQHATIRSLLAAVVDHAADDREDV